MSDEKMGPVDRYKMYSSLAWLWPLMDTPEEYAGEALHWVEALWAHLGEGPRDILYLGAGGGCHMSHFTGDFNVTAVDVSGDMLAVSQQLNPDVEHIQGDMRSIRLDRTFDAVLIHDGIVYMATEADLRAAFESARRHLRPGGVLITVPDFCRETFSGTDVGDWSIEEEGLEVTFVQYLTDPDPSDTSIEAAFVYFIRQDGELRVEVDRHEQGLFPEARWEELMSDAGFDVGRWPCPDRQLKQPMDLLVGVAREPVDG